MHDKLADVRAHAPIRLRYLPGVDGLRALAVLSVLLYHARDGGFGGLRGGFLGVEVFFVISGYLITSLLLAERQGTGRNRLGGFYVRRARRLLPPLLLTLAAVAFIAVVFLPSEVATLRGDLAASLTYSTNWFFVVVQKSYFEFTARPSLVQHLWSLAIEEQFYLVWPLFFAAGMKVFGRTRLLVIILATAIGSVVLMAVLYSPGVDPSRIYYGTDTRASALLLGAALAMVWSPWRLQRSTGKGAPVLLDLVGVGALVALCSLLFSTDEFSSALYRGGFLKVTVCTLVLIAVAAHPAARLGRVLGCRPMRWIGLRSYGIYLYHWPVYQLTRPGQDIALTGASLLGLRVAITMVLATLSYRYVEMPIRHGALARRVAALRADGPGRAALVARTVGVAGVVVVAVAVLGSAVVRAPGPAETLVAAGASVGTGSAAPGGEESTVATIVDPLVAFGGSLPNTGARGPASTTVPVAAPTITGPLVDFFGGPVAPPTTAAPAAPEAPAPDPDAAAPAAAAAAATGAPAPPAPFGRITALGDSVMLGASTVLQVGLPASTFVDARVGRQVSEGIEILRAWRDQGFLGDAVVIHLGNNGTFAPEQFDQIAQLLHDVRRVVFVTVKVPRPWEESVNQTIVDGVSRMPNAVLVDWRDYSMPHPEWFWDDAMHLRPEGAAAYNQVIAANL